MKLDKWLNELIVKVESKYSFDDTYLANSQDPADAVAEAAKRSMLRDLISKVDDEDCVELELSRDVCLMNSWVTRRIYVVKDVDKLLDRIKTIEHIAFTKGIGYERQRNQDLAAGEPSESSSGD